MPGFKQFLGSFLPHKKQIASYNNAIRKGIVGTAFLGLSYCFSYLRKTFGDGEGNGHEVSFAAATGQAILIDCAQEVGRTTLDLYTQRNTKRGNIIDKVNKAKRKRMVDKSLYLAKTSFDILISVYLLASSIDPLRQKIQSEDYTQSKWQKEMALETDKTANLIVESGFVPFQTLLNNNIALAFALLGLISKVKDIYTLMR